MSYEQRNFFPTHQNSQNAYLAGLGTPPLSPLPYYDGQNIIKFRWTPITHAHMLKSDTHLGLILSSNLLIGSVAESLLSESNVRTIRTSSDFSANKKQEKSISFKLN